MTAKKNPAPAVEYKRVPLSTLKPDPKNARRHDDRNLGVVRSSLQRFGQVEPLVVQKRTGIIIGGNGRYEVLKKDGATHADVALLDCDDKTASALSIALNRSAELASWDVGTLTSTLSDLEAAGWDTENLPGFSRGELDALTRTLSPPAPLEVQEDEVPPPPKKPRTRLGDVWTFPSGHRVICGDSLRSETYLSLLEGRQPGMAFTDPPYNTGMTSKTQSFPGKRLAKKRAGETKWLTHMFDDDFTPEAWAALLDGFTAHLAANLAEDSVAYVCLDWRRSHEIVPRLQRHFRFSNLIVWDKMVHGLGSDYKFTHEFIHVAKKGKPKLSTHQGDRELSDVWHVQRKLGHDEDHATKKPLELPARAMRHATKAGDAVLDPFLGSGSTLVAAEQLGRICYGIEISPAYVDVTIQRYVTLTGKRPTNQDGEEWRPHA